MSRNEYELGVVLTGGGALAAYQVGVLRAICRSYPQFHIPILTAVSAGAINAAFLASHDDTTPRAVDKLRDLWCSLEFQDIFEVDTATLARSVMSWGARLLSGGSSVGTRVRGLVDTEPLRRLLSRHLCHDGEHLAGVEERIARGDLRALAITTLNYSTGQTVIWVQGRSIEHWERPLRRSRQAPLTVSHVMASSALPLVFPAIPLGDAWYGDGGVRLAAPLSPALHLGADRILAISTRYVGTFEEADRPRSIGYPPPIQVAGHLLNSIFLDLIDQDALRMQRFNDLLDKIPPRKRGDMRKVDLLVIRPSRDLAELAAEHEVSIPKSMRYLLRGLGAKETSRPDLLSFLMFSPRYLAQLVQMGEDDTDRRMPEILAFLTGEAQPEPDPDVSRLVSG